MSDRGRVHPEFVILLSLAGIGAAVGMPHVLRLFRHESLTTAQWVWLGIGAVLFLLGVVPFAWAFISVWLEMRRNR